VSNRILVDTQFVVALINQRDQNHAQALEQSARFEGHPVLITDAVLLEIGSVLARGFRREAVAAIEGFLTADEVGIVHLTPQLFQQALALYKAHDDKERSLVDCISFIVMRDAGLSQALTYDQHFVQAGFQALMREGSQT
jgi:predicted nucleic acid-binding protein